VPQFDIVSDLFADLFTDLLKLYATFVQASCNIYVIFTYYSATPINTHQHPIKTDSTGVTVLKANLTLVAVLLSASALAQEAPKPVATSSATTTNPAYLAANCANCHGTTGNAQGMPGLAGLKADYIAEQMRSFRDGKRTATIMHQLSKGYTDAQIDAIAGYFAAQTAK
jgi:cytochrome subunit of sulfide dehydrogenase